MLMYVSQASVANKVYSATIDSVTMDEAKCYLAIAEGGCTTLKTILLANRSGSTGPGARQHSYRHKFPLAHMHYSQGALIGRRIRPSVDDSLDV